LKAKADQYEKRSSSLLEILLKAYSQFEEGSLVLTSGGYQIDLNNLRKRKVE
jgi:hypothetical protein